MARLKSSPRTKPVHATTKSSTTDQNKSGVDMSSRDRAVLEGPRGAHTWNSEERRTLFLVMQELDITRDDAVTLMHACFPHLMPKYNAWWKTFSDIYISRTNATHSKEWFDIAKLQPGPLPNSKRVSSGVAYSSAEIADFARIRARVHQVATENHITIVLRTPPNGFLHPTGAAVPPVPRQNFPPADTKIATHLTLGYILNHQSAEQKAARKKEKKEAAAKAKKMKAATQSKKFKAATQSKKREADASKDKSPKRRPGARVSYREDSEDEGEEWGTANPKKQETTTRSKKRKASAPKDNPRKRRPGAKVSYREDSEDEGEEWGGHQSLMNYGKTATQEVAGGYEDGSEDEAEEGIDEYTDQEDDGQTETEEPEEENMSAPTQAYFDGPISEDGYDLANVAGARFRGGKEVLRPVPANIPNTLPMVHHGSLSTVELRDGGSIVSADITQRFDEETHRAHDDNHGDQQAYRLGGAVLRVYYPATHDSFAHFADTMVCDPVQCVNSACQGVARPYTFPAMAKSGKPFIHWEDCASNDEDELLFFPDHFRGPTTVNIDPALTREAQVIFHDGFETFAVEALVCSEGECKRCALRKSGREDEQEIVELDREQMRHDEEQKRGSEISKVKALVPQGPFGQKVLGGIAWQGFGEWNAKNDPHGLSRAGLGYDE